MHTNVLVLCEALVAQSGSGGAREYRSSQGSGRERNVFIYDENNVA